MGHLHQEHHKLLTISKSPKLLHTTLGHPQTRRRRLTPLVNANEPPTAAQADSNSQRNSSRPSASLQFLPRQRQACPTFTTSTSLPGPHETPNPHDSFTVSSSVGSIPKLLATTAVPKLRGGGTAYRLGRRNILSDRWKIPTLWAKRRQPEPRGTGWREKGTRTFCRWRTSSGTGC